MISLWQFWVNCGNAVPCLVFTSHTGAYCPQNTRFAWENPCPAGTYNNRTRAASPFSCLPCIGEYLFAFELWFVQYIYYSFVTNCSWVYDQLIVQCTCQVRISSQSFLFSLMYVQRNQVISCSCFGKICYVDMLCREDMINWSVIFVQYGQLFRCWMELIVSDCLLNDLTWGHWFMWFLSSLTLLSLALVEFAALVISTAGWLSLSGVPAARPGLSRNGPILYFQPAHHIPTF